MQGWQDHQCPEVPEQGENVVVEVIFSEKYVGFFLQIAICLFLHVNILLYDGGRGWVGN